MILIPPATTPMICRDCDQPGIVGLDESWFCPTCFEIELRESVARIETAIARAKLALPPGSIRAGAEPIMIAADALERIDSALGRNRP